MTTEDDPRGPTDRRQSKVAKAETVVVLLVAVTVWYYLRMNLSGFSLYVALGFTGLSAASVHEHLRQRRENKDAAATVATSKNADRRQSKVEKVEAVVVVFVAVTVWYLITMIVHNAISTLIVGGFLILVTASVRERLHQRRERAADSARGETSVDESAS